MYFAGLELSLSHNQGLELIIVSTALFQLAKGTRDVRRTKKIADAQAGSVDKSTLPTSLVGSFVTPIQGLTLVLPPIVYITGVVGNGLVQPAWMERWRLPFEIGVQEETWVRTGACVAALGMSICLTKLFGRLGKQWHHIGVREKSSVVSTGPYSIVRHPMYSVALVQEALYIAMFWSYVPVVALGMTMAALAVKMSIEEKLMIDNPVTGPDYVLYKQKVRSRVIPYIW